MTTTPTTPETLLANVKAAKFGDTLVCTGAFPAWRTGTWPNGKLTGITFDLTAATVTGWDLGNLVDCAFVGGKFTALDTAPALQITNSKGIRIAGLSAKGTVAGHGYAVSLGTCEAVTVVGLVAEGLRAGVKAGDVLGLEVSGSEFRMMGSDGINMAFCRNVDIHHNIFHMFSPTPGAHPDGVQTNTPTDRYPRCINVTVRDNTIVGICQGMLLRGIDGVTVARNRIHVGEPTAIGVQNCTAAVIDSNGYLLTLPSALYQAHIDQRGSTVTYKGFNEAPAFRNTARVAYPEGTFTVAP